MNSSAIRLSVQSRLRQCDVRSSFNVREPCFGKCKSNPRRVRGGASDEELARALCRVWYMRGDRYSEIRSAATMHLPKVEMSHIGG